MNLYWSDIGKRTSKSDLIIMAQTIEDRKEMKRIVQTWRKEYDSLTHMFTSSTSKSRDFKWWNKTATPFKNAIKLVEGVIDDIEREERLQARIDKEHRGDARGATPPPWTLKKN